MPKIVVAAERVVPGQPVAQDRRLVRQQRHDRAEHLLIGAEHPLGVDHALWACRSIPRCRAPWRWCPVRPRACASSTALVGAAAASSAANGGACAALRRGVQVTISVSPATCGQRPLEQRAPRRRTPGPGRSACHKRAERGVVARQQRVGRRERRVQDARVHGRQRQQRVLEAVAGQDDDRPVGRQPAIDQRLRERAGPGAALSA